ncbi:cytochrome P450 [Fomitopsis serialis]|uniref:cytochrome P450 n=1 Tax=Fomitopsis serialis TaxID=139415 RepID=UPI00200743AB|nr:cytochrome P450 [Neoantrodia serialis]KAH9924019.1 cytochrome P450 [Neoantrodia serialis]
MDWRKTYGDVVYLQIFNRPTIVLNSAKAMDELLNKYGYKYSDRPRTLLITELIGFTNNVTIMPYGEQWRCQRRWFQAALQSASALESYIPVQRRESVRLLAGLVNASQSLEYKIGDQECKALFVGLKRYVGAVMVDIMIAYGHGVLSHDTQFMDLAELAVAGIVEAGSAGASLVDFFPVCESSSGKRHRA